MVNYNLKVEKGGFLKNQDIIDAILKSNFEALEVALDENPYCVNAIHEESQMNAAMLSAAGRLPKFLNKILNFGEMIDFAYVDGQGNDLLDCAMMSMSDDVIKQVQNAYILHAPQILNNWPEP